MKGIVITKGVALVSSLGCYDDMVSVVAVAVVVGEDVVVVVMVVMVVEMVSVGYY